METKTDLPPISPSLQLSFFHKLQDFKLLHFKEALQTTMSEINIMEVDNQLNLLVPAEYLQKLASFSLRGETVFPIPILLQKNPRLLGYYRLLLGFSQKEFYSKGPFGKFKSMEEKGVLTQFQIHSLSPLCKSLIVSSQFFLDGIEKISLNQLAELQLLTLGAQFRGTKNNELGNEATRKIFNSIKEMVAVYIINEDLKSLTVLNTSKRKVHIHFSSDPDIHISEEMSKNKRPLVSIEIKGGQDLSNIHNRIGEAEKSHQKAKSKRFFEFITILNVNIDYEILKKESPTTSHFFHLEKIIHKKGTEYSQFKELLFSIMGLR